MCLVHGVYSVVLSLALLSLTQGLAFTINVQDSIVGPYLGWTWGSKMGLVHSLLLESFGPTIISDQGAIYC